MQWLTRLFDTSILKFTVVGSIGFLVDASVLMLTHSYLGLNLYAGRVLSFTLAVLATWFLNQHWTFKRQTSYTDNSYRIYSYYLIQITGALINFGIYSYLINQSEFFYSWPVLSLAVGSVVAMLFTYNSTRYLFS